MKLYGFTIKIIRWLVYAIGGIVALLLLGLGISYLFYSSWKTNQLEIIAASGQIIETDIGTIEYLLKGDEGPVTLYIHGSPGGYDSAPPENGFGRILVPSRPGYLGTPLDVGSTPSEQARSYAILMDVLGITEPVIVKGVSGGGPSAISFASTYPERTAALILVEPVSQSITYEDEGRPSYMRSDFSLWLIFRGLEKMLGAEGMVPFVIPAQENQGLVLENPEKIEQLSSLIWLMWPVSLRNAGWDNDVQQIAELSLAYADVIAPTLIIHGTDDANVPFADSEILATQISGARLYSIEGGDHMMPFTHLDEVELVQEEFLKGLSVWK